MVATLDVSPWIHFFLIFAYHFPQTTLQGELSCLSKGLSIWRARNYAYQCMYHFPSDYMLMFDNACNFENKVWDWKEVINSIFFTDFM